MCSFACCLFLLRTQATCLSLLCSFSLISSKGSYACYPPLKPPPSSASHLLFNSHSPAPEAASSLAVAMARFALGFVMVAALAAVAAARPAVTLNPRTFEPLPASRYSRPMGSSRRPTLHMKDRRPFPIYGSFVFLFRSGSLAHIFFSLVLTRSSPFSPSSLLSFLASCSVTPRGWLLAQLELQAEGLSGHLALFWGDIMNSSWIGGPDDGGLHERAPYWYVH